MRKQSHGIRNMLVITLIALMAAGVIVPLGLRTPPRNKPPDLRFEVLTPILSRIYGDDYRAVVNDAGGMNVAHVFVYGRYVGGRFVANGRRYVWK